MTRKKHEPGVPLSGKISDRIRSGNIPKEYAKKVDRVEAAPKASSILRAIGRGLGLGATKRRSGS